jgi:hypothetical protein
MLYFFCVCRNLDLIVLSFTFIQLNMQAAFLISAKGFTEKQIGVLFLVFSLSQFLCMAPAGYYLDYSNNKINWVICAGILTSALTVLTTLTADPGGENMGLMILLKILQGAATAILPSGFNAITLGIVGSTGFTHQVSRNKMMNHIGTALVVAIGSLIAFLLYPNIGVLFIVSPLATIGMYYNLVRIKPTHVDRDAARCLIIESPTMTEYEHLDGQRSIDGMCTEGSDSCNVETENRLDSSIFSQSYIPPDSTREIGNPAIFERSPHYLPNPEEDTPSNVENEFIVDTQPERSPRQERLLRNNYNPSTAHVRSYSPDPSCNFGWGRARDESGATTDADTLKARTPMAVLMDPTLVTFTMVIFFFHLSNSSVLPLVMQSLALQDPQAGILLSGLCILIAQGFSSYFAKICGDYTPEWGRKGLTMVGLASLTIRCSLLTMLSSAQEQAETSSQSNTIQALILSTQVLDSVGGGIIGTLQILITNDISCRTGRFSLMLGVTTGAMCLGATVSGYIGQSIAQDHGYMAAFTSLGAISLIPLFMYMFCMPETLPDYAKPIQRRRRIMALLRKLNDQRRRLALKANPFRRRAEKVKEDVLDEKLHPGNESGELDITVPSVKAEWV